MCYTILRNCTFPNIPIVDDITNTTTNTTYTYTDIFVVRAVLSYALQCTYFVIMRIPACGTYTTPIQGYTYVFTAV